ncbi:hypothetical protein AOQ84DRAFT_393803 [Glonium stellatum]|uniref:Uncharacterized protein n=1 Tax=Glonium stellatum TaxID=574774 RepID=A0A8E2EM94_9PEZI|nr:hypothetical protein AOQ84DRAFT_393803 [Glonium stellatum]
MFPENQSMLSLQGLNDDVLRLIIGEIFRDDDRLTLDAVSKVSRRLYQISVPWLYRRVIILFTARSHRALLLRLLKDGSKLLSFIRELRIKRYLRSASEQQGQILELLHRLKRLESFWWDDYCDMPDVFLNFLHEKWPNARIIIDAEQVCPVRVKYSLNRNSAFVWPSSYCLHTFIFRAARQYEFDRSFKLNLFRTIKRSPNLKILQIWDFVSGPFGNLDDMSSELKNDCNLTTGVAEHEAKSEDLPRLEELTLAGRILPLFTQNELNVWGSNDGWAKLKRLMLKPSDCLPAFLGRVPSLEVLDCSSYLSKAIEDYTDPTRLEKPKPLLGVLRELEYQGFGITFPIEVLQHVSRTLISLKMHNMDTFVHQNGSTEPADAQYRDVITLNDTCPWLETLAVDMWRERVWPEEFFTALARFRYLINVTIFVERPSEIGTSPVIDKDSCKYIYKFIQDRKCGKRLRRLEIKQHKMGVTVGPSSSPQCRGPVSSISPDYTCASTKEGDILVDEVYWQQNAKCNKDAEELRLLTKNIKCCSTGRLVLLAREFDNIWTERELGADVLAEANEDLDDDFSIGPVATSCPDARGFLDRFKEGSSLIPRISDSRSMKALGKVVRFLCLGYQAQPKMKEGSREQIIKQVLLQRKVEMRAKKFFNENATLFDIIESYSQVGSYGDSSLSLYESLLEIRRNQSAPRAGDAQ